MSKPWGAIGAWADEAERADEEQASEAAATAKVADDKSFPSLKEAATATGKTKKQKKKMSLSEFKMGAYAAPSATSSAGLTRDQIAQLPTGPRQRSEDEMQSGRIGGGFPSYRSGGAPGQMNRNRDDSDGSWASGRRNYGGFDDDQRGSQSRVSDFPQPSRADEVDDWGKAKKTLPSLDQGRQSRYGGLGAGGGGGGSFGAGGRGGGYGGGGGAGSFSKADEVDNWGAGKTQSFGRSSTFGSGYGGGGGAGSFSSSGGVSASGVQEERRRLVLEPRKVDAGVSETSPSVVKTSKPNPFGAARPREQVLAEKGLDYKKLDSEIEAKKGNSQSRPSSAQSSRPSSAQSNKSESSGLNNVENVVKPRPKVNPFGDAKPREVLLEEQGKDWRKMDSELEHRRIDRPETEAEKVLKEEIEELRKKLDKEAITPENKESEQESNSNDQNLTDLIQEKEKDLDVLIRELDDKVRFRPKPVDRPGSGAGRPHSRGGSFDESRNVEYTDRPRSRGQGDDRRNFQGSKERGFFNNRNVDRSSSSKNGW